MNSPVSNSISNAVRDNTPGSAEATLRLLANLPAPEGLEDRVMVSLKTAPRTARVLHWPSVLQPTGSWMRGAAAAAIVFVVAGGGWGVYTRVQPSQPARVLVMPARAGAAAGFSSAGAMRTPQTLNGPFVAAPAKGNSEMDDRQPVQVSPLKRLPAPVVPMTHKRAHAGAVHKAGTQPAVSAAK